MENPIQEPPKSKSSVALALMLAFIPAAILILAISMVNQRHISQSQQSSLLWLAAVISAFCCLTSSAMLFRRGTAIAIVGAILLFLLNGFIAFFFGCCASFSY